jgi:hypothetical protein
MTAARDHFEREYAKAIEARDHFQREYTEATAARNAALTKSVT